MQITFQASLKKKLLRNRAIERGLRFKLVPATISSLSIFNSLLFKDSPDHKMEISHRKSLRNMQKLEISSNKFLQQRKLTASKLRCVRFIKKKKKERRLEFACRILFLHTGVKIHHTWQTSLSLLKRTNERRMDIYVQWNYIFAINDLFRQMLCPFPFIQTTFFFILWQILIRVFQVILN